MKSNFTDDHNLLLKLGFKALKYFVLALVGFAIAYAISTCLGGSDIASNMLLLVKDWVFQLGVILLALIGVAIIVESLR